MESLAPTVLWRLFRSGKENVRAVILPGGPPFTLAFFANDELDRADNYDDMDLALFRAAEIKRSLLEDGWRDQ
ncbi:MAG: hypothetical protein ABI665_15945 [Vicinamibacterales bacterium]